MGRRFPGATETLTSCLAPAFNVPCPGFRLSQLDLLAEEADQLPLGPQLVSVTVCGIRSACLWVAVKLSDGALAWMHCAAPPCGTGDGETVNVTPTFTVLDPSVKVITSW